MSFPDTHTELEVSRHCRVPVWLGTQGLVPNWCLWQGSSLSAPEANWAGFRSPPRAAWLDLPVRIVDNTAL